MAPDSQFGATTVPQSRAQTRRSRGSRRSSTRAFAASPTVLHACRSRRHHIVSDQRPLVFGVHHTIVWGNVCLSRQRFTSAIYPQTLLDLLIAYTSPITGDLVLRGFPWHERVEGRTCSGRVEGTPAKAVGRAWWGHPPCIDPQRLPFPRGERCRCIRDRLDDRGWGWGRWTRTVLCRKPRISAVSAPVPRNSRKNHFFWL